MTACFRHWAALVLPIVVLLAIWSWFVPEGSRLAFLLGRPDEIADAARILIFSNAFWADVWASILVLCLGFTIGIVAGFFLGLIVWQLAKLGRVVESYVIALGSIPLFAVAPLLIFIFGASMSTRVVIVTLSVAVPMLLSCLTAAREIERQFEPVTSAFRGSRWKAMRWVIAPGTFYAALPTLKAAVNTALVAVFLSEWITAEHGLAKFVLASMSVFAVPNMWVGLIAFVLVGVSFAALVDSIEFRLTRWRRK
jgi:NitT/TauT family transport system permease protein